MKILTSFYVSEKGTFNFVNSSNVILVMDRLPEKDWPNFEGAYYILDENLDFHRLPPKKNTVFAPNISKLIVNDSLIKKGERVITHLVAPELELVHNGGSQFGGTLIIKSYDAKGNSVFIYEKNDNKIRPLFPNDSVEISISELISSDPIAEQ